MRVPRSMRRARDRRHRRLPAGARGQQRRARRARVDTSDEWIVERTGIRQRHIAAEGEMTSDLASAAAREALAERRRSRPIALDLIVRRDLDARPHLPGLRHRGAAQARRRPGRRLRRAGGLQRLHLRARDRRQLRHGRARPRPSLVIGAETFSRLLDWRTARPACCSATAPARSCCAPRRAPARRSTAACWRPMLGSDGRHYDDLYVDGGPSSTGTTGHCA